MCPKKARGAQGVMPENPMYAWEGGEQVNREMGGRRGKCTFKELSLSLGAGFVWGRQTEPLTTLKAQHPSEVKVLRGAAHYPYQWLGKEQARLGIGLGSFP